GFFFSSRRRHTRSKRDWSSDVCSSDLGIKFVAISVTVLSIYGIFNHVSLGSLIMISLLTTIVSFLIGDLVILRKFGNLVASIVDFFLAFGTLWVLSMMFISGALPL